ncbi:hypothetical protein Pmani_035063 [Petrolisthes manimaculis]|uniref:Uncharacterized protein n=1 Tax=Petrolisthes manimaculis TaxID=1843537 RepID=A0AAE1NMF5_9EUCA|nr:hypothetical protein Pmani_035063 [Petrolisthes manimaculis]
MGSGGGGGVGMMGSGGGGVGVMGSGVDGGGDQFYGSHHERDKSRDSGEFEHNLTIWDGGMRVLAEEDCMLLRSLNYTTTSTTFGNNITCLGHAPIYTRESQVRTIVLAVMAVLSMGETRPPS